MATAHTARSLEKEINSHDIISPASQTILCRNLPKRMFWGHNFDPYRCEKSVFNSNLSVCWSFNIPSVTSLKTVEVLEMTRGEGKSPCLIPPPGTHMFLKCTRKTPVIDGFYTIQSAVRLDAERKEVTTDSSYNQRFRDYQFPSQIIF